MRRLKFFTRNCSVVCATCTIDKTAEINTQFEGSPLSLAPHINEFRIYILQQLLEFFTCSDVTVGKDLRNCWCVRAMEATRESVDFETFPFDTLTSCFAFCLQHCENGVNCQKHRSTHSRSPAVRSRKKPPRQNRHEFPMESWRPIQGRERRERRKMKKALHLSCA